MDNNKKNKKQHNKELVDQYRLTLTMLKNNKGSADGAVIQTIVHYSENCEDPVTHK